MIANIIERQCRLQPDSTGLVTAGRPWTYRELHELVRAVSSSVVLSGNRPVAVVMTGEGEAVAGLAAISAQDLPAVLVSASLPVGDVKEVMRQMRLGTVLLPPSAHESTWKDEGSEGETIGGLTCIRLKQETAGALEQPLPAGICQLTSGSLARPKIALRTWPSIAVEIEAICERLELTSRDNVWCASSLAHSYGLIGGLLASLQTGAQLSLNTSPQENSAVADRPTVVLGLGPAYEQWLRFSEREFFSETRAALSAGAPLPRRLFDEFARCFGIEIRQDYGTTETGTISINVWPHTSPFSVGLPLPHQHVRLSDFSTGGEIEVRGPAVSLGYVHDGELTRILDDKGWYRTGDAGSWDTSGGLSVGRRLRDPIVRQGIAIDPGVVESALEELPGVREVAVLGIEEKRREPLLRAVVAGTGLDEPNVRNWCLRNLPPEQQPDEIDIRDILPRSPAGKVLHRYL